MFGYQTEKTEGLLLTEISKNESGKRELKTRKREGNRKENKENRKETERK